MCFRCMYMYGEYNQNEEFIYVAKVVIFHYDINKWESLLAAFNKDNRKICSSQRVTNISVIRSLEK